MAKKPLVSKGVQAGDPITADIFNNFYTDLNTLATPEVVSNVVIKNTNDSSTSSKTTDLIWHSGVKAVKIPAGDPKQQTYTFTDVKWAEPPAVWVQFYTEGMTLPTWGKSQIFTQVQSVTTTAAKIYFRCAVAADIKVIVFATGKTVSA